MFERIPGFYRDAAANEEAFRAILKDVGERAGIEDLDLDVSLDKILAKYSPIDKTQRNKRFTVLDFRRKPPHEAAISVQSSAILSGMGFLFRYGIYPDNSVAYLGVVTDWVL
jgi:hypothetical protein